MRATRFDSTAPAGLTIDLAAATGDAVSSLDALHAIVGDPAAVSVDKVQDRMSRRVMDFVRRSPFFLIATANEHGACDVSPRGDPAGQVRILDQRRLVLPDRQGNNRVDSLRNLVTNPHVGLLFLVPGSDETLRINGTATISRHVPLLEQLAIRGKMPRLALIVEIAEVYMHCGRAFRRSQLWDSSSWPAKADVASMAAVLKEQLDMPGDLADLERERNEKYDRTLY
ncbi:MAG: hypothetical protein AVDCRST_MAG87-2475 [uncultured Thermomicrobiales bacterium]|uniref:Pyridoxamine 5'-phosphate oxidase N-terminal domain-containing protein n=1 Tax=uncultured Thermomicrobiales bacterium TaxID=1645740 RepID=A0A6J4V914_9BACT|nr:MAG: hypothetical protein AVDCRST_MAG87-2475 [uncultured Thermomicrobiales bacterium]